MEHLQDVLLKEFSEESERSFSLGDTYDMKANVLLVVLTFLAGQSVYFLSLSHFWPIRYGQFLSSALIIISGVMILVELLPRNYQGYFPSNGAIERKISELRDKHKKNEEMVASELRETKIEWARSRASKNKEINARKSRLLDGAFWFLLTAILLNLATLAAFAMFPFLLAH
jgi:hypothetical protein